MQRLGEQLPEGCKLKAGHVIHLAALDVVERLLSSHQYAFLDLLAGSH